MKKTLLTLSISLFVCVVLFSQTPLKLTCVDNAYHARGYYPAIMRFTTPDPLAEKKPWISTYAYCSNNPVNRIDPDGMDDYYSRIGQFLFRDYKETDNLIIREENYVRKSLIESGLDTEWVRAMPEHFDKALGDMTLSAESYSNIFTDILSKMGDVNVEKLYNQKVSVRVMDGWNTSNDFFNEPTNSRVNAGIST